MSDCSHQSSNHSPLLSPAIPCHSLTTRIATATPDTSRHTQDGQNTAAGMPHHQIGMQRDDAKKRPPSGRKHAKWTDRGLGEREAREANRQVVQGTPRYFLFFILFYLRFCTTPQTPSPFAKTHAIPRHPHHLIHLCHDP